MPKNAPGRAICEVGFTRDIFGADVKLSGERVNELVDTFEGLMSYPYFSQLQLQSNLGPPDLSLGIDATLDLVQPSPAP